MRELFEELFGNETCHGIIARCLKRLRYHFFDLLEEAGRQLDIEALEDWAYKMKI